MSRGCSSRRKYPVPRQLIQQKELLDASSAIPVCAIRYMLMIKRSGVDRGLGSRLRFLVPDSVLGTNRTPVSEHI